MNIENPYREISICFRVLDVPDMIVNKFQTDLQDLPITHSKWAYGPELDTKHHVCPDGPISIMQIEISDKLNCLKLQKYLEKQAMQLSFGIWVSLVTDSDSDGLSIPTYVVDFLRSVGGTLDFSFVCVADWG